MLKFQNFGRPPGQPRLPAPFSPAVGQNSKFRSQRFVCLVVPIPKRCNTTPLPQTPGGNRLFRGPGLTRTKISCKELSGPSKFCADPSNGSKVFWKVWFRVWRWFDFDEHFSNLIGYSYECKRGECLLDFLKSWSRFVKKSVRPPWSWSRRNPTQFLSGFYPPQDISPIVDLWI